MSTISCKTTSTKIKEPPRIWWGKTGDTVEWEKAKQVMENYDWMVLDQSLYKEK